MIGRWYDAVGGLGLEVNRDGIWSVAGYIQKRRGKKLFDIRVNPDQDEGYTLATHLSLVEAKADFLDRMGVTEIEGG